MSEKPNVFTQKHVIGALKEKNNIMYQYLKKKGLLTAYAKALLQSSRRGDGTPDISLFVYRITHIFGRDYRPGADKRCDEIWSCFDMNSCKELIPATKNTNWYEIAKEITKLKEVWESCDLEYLGISN